MREILALIIIFIVIFLVKNYAILKAKIQNNLSGYCSHNKKIRGGEGSNYKLPFSIHKDFLSSNDIQNLLKCVETKYVPSEVLSGKDIKTRKSEQAWIAHGENYIADRMISKACEIFHTPISHAESVQIVRYNAGEFYKPHQDSCCDDTEECRIFKQDSGERIGTFLIYLTDDFSDGGTNFPNVGITVKPHVGSGISWYAKGCPAEALHGGADVHSGTKIIANVWIRERPFVLS